MKIAKEIGKYILVFLILILLFSASMIFTYALPNNRIRVNVQKSIDLLEKDGQPFYINYDGANLDAFTDSIMLNQSIDVAENEGIEITKRAFSNYFNSEDDTPQITNLRNFYSGNIKISQYERYWHGYVTILRPLLIFLDYAGIRQLNVIIVFMLLVLTSILMSKKIGTKYAISFAISIILMNVFVIPMAMQYMNIYVTTLLGIIAILLVKEEKLKNNLPFIFLILGMVTAFFDLLTYPLLTLGMPLVVAFIRMNKKDEQIDIKELIFTFIKVCVLWGIGYGMTYVSKWILTSIVIGENIIPQAIAQFMFRTGANEDLSKIEVIIKNLKNYYTRPVVAVLILFAILWIYLIIKHRKEKINLKSITALIVIALMPYVWYVVLSNHSNIHAWFTYRIQAITLFAILSAMLEPIEIKTKTEELINER